MLLAEYNDTQVGVENYGQSVSLRAAAIHPENTWGVFSRFADPSHLDRLTPPNSSFLDPEAGRDLALAGHTMSAKPQRALILAGGGPVGEAWESGIIVGLKEQGVDVSNADLIIGTSAGSIVGARLASGMRFDELIAAALASSAGPPPEASDEAPGPPPDLSFLAAKLREMASPNVSLQLIYTQIGEWALKAHPVVSEAGFVASYRRRFPNDKWPSHTYRCVAIDASDGSLKVWDHTSGVPTALAVASSCALPGVFAPVTISGHRYMDGGVRSVTNADLARGCQTALILAPTSGLEDPIARDFTRPLAAEMRLLRTDGCEVELIAPDAAGIRAFGQSVSDEQHRRPAYDAGHTQGKNLAPAIVGFWKG
jgi:NTE family protein